MSIDAQSINLEALQSLFSSSEGVEETKKKGNKEARASLLHLEDLLNQLLEETGVGSGKQEGKEKHVGSKKGKVFDDILNRLGPTLSKALEQNPDKASLILKSLASLLEEYTKKDPKALEKATAVLAPVIFKFVRAHPNDQMSLLKTFAPVLKSIGGEASDRLNQSGAYFHKFIQEVQHANPKDVSEKLQKELGPLLSGVHPEALEELEKSLEPNIHALYEKDPAKLQQFLNHLMPILSLISIGHPKNSAEIGRELANSGLLEEIYALDTHKGVEALRAIAESIKDVNAGISPDAAIDTHSELLQGVNKKGFSKLLGNFEGKHQLPDSQINNDIITDAMIALQMFQVAVSKSQSNQDQVQMMMNKAKLNSAMNEQQHILDQVAKIDAEKAKANQRPWWSWLIAALVAIIGAVVAALTAGVAACICAVIVGAFMASPAFSKVVQAIAAKIEPALENKYYQDDIKKGMSPEKAHQDAHERAEATADLIAKIVVVVAVAVVSFGVGGITAGAEGAANDAADGAAGAAGDSLGGEVEMVPMACGAADGTSEAGDEAAEGGIGARAAEGGGDDASDAASSLSDDEESTAAGEEMRGAQVRASKYGYSFKQAAKIAAFQGTSVLGSSNPAMDIMMASDPEWVKKHMALAIILDVISEAIMMLLTLGTGKVAFGNMVGSSGEGISKALRALIPISYITQAGEGGSTIASGIIGAESLNSAAHNTEALAKMEKELANLMGAIRITQATEKIINESAQNIAKDTSQSMNLLQNAAGYTGSVVDQLLINAAS